jgi:hypothetical protein
MARFSPGGVVEIDVKSVVASGKVQPYEVLPKQAGLIQLVKSGALERTKDGFYLIKKTFSNFPAGLTSAHGVKFILATGVEMPGSDPRHSTIILQETGECVAGSQCP